MAGILAATACGLRRQAASFLVVRKNPGAVFGCAAPRMIKRAAWKVAPGLCGRVLDRIQGQSALKIGGAVVVVTGAGKGIGRAVARSAAGEGAQVVAVARTRTDLDSLIAEAGSRVIGVQADISDPRDTARVAQLAFEKCSRVDILVNNAGIGCFDSLEKMPPEDIDAMIDTNLKGAVHLARAVAGSMARRRCGAIINVSSILGLNAGPGESVYAATKFGLIGFTTALAKELKAFGVTVSAVCPGAVDTGFAANRNAAANAETLTVDEVAAEVLSTAARGSRIVKLEKTSGRVAREVLNRF